MQTKISKVILREKSMADASNDYVWRVDEELSRLDATQPLTISYRDFLAFFEEEIEYPSPQRVRFAIYTPEGKHIGNCMYYDINPVRGEAELGIMIGDRDYWNRGYGEQSVKVLLRHIFTTTKLKKVYLHTLDWNYRAQKCFEKCGFVPTGRAERDGYRFVAMEIKRDQWKKLVS